MLLQILFEHFDFCYKFCCFQKHANMNQMLSSKAALLQECLKVCRENRGSTSAAPATLSCSIPFLSFSSMAEYWMDCTWLKLARCVGWWGKKQKEWGVSGASCCKRAVIRCSFATHSGSLVGEVTDPFLRPDRQLDLDHPAGLLRKRDQGARLSAVPDPNQRGAA